MLLLEGELVLSVDEYRLNRDKALVWLDNLAASASGKSLYLPHGVSLSLSEGALSHIPGIAEIKAGLMRVIAESVTGAVFFHDDVSGYLVVPPFAITQEQAAEGYLVSPLTAILERQLMIALIIIRLGAYAVGVFQRERLLSSKVGRGNIHARHRKGGSSAHRFERHREKQIEGFFTRICCQARVNLEPHLKDIDHVIFSGAPETLLSFRRQCRFLKQLSDRTLDMPLNIRKPRQATLETAIARVWSSRVLHWYPG